MKAAGNALPWANAMAYQQVKQRMNDARRDWTQQHGWSVVIPLGMWPQLPTKELNPYWHPPLARLTKGQMLERPAPEYEMGLRHAHWVTRRTTGSSASIRLTSLALALAAEAPARGARNQLARHGLRCHRRHRRRPRAGWGWIRCR